MSSPGFHTGDSRTLSKVSEPAEHCHPRAQRCLHTRTHTCTHTHVILMCTHRHILTYSHTCTCIRTAYVHMHAHTLAHTCAQLSHMHVSKHVCMHIQHTRAQMPTHARTHDSRAHTTHHTCVPIYSCARPHTGIHRHTHTCAHTHVHIHRGGGLSVRGELFLRGALRSGALAPCCSPAAEPESAEGAWRPGHLGTKECPWLVLGFSHFVLFSGKQLEKKLHSHIFGG